MEGNRQPEEDQGWWCSACRRRAAAGCRGAGHDVLHSEAARALLQRELMPHQRDVAAAERAVARAKQVLQGAQAGLEEAQQALDKLQVEIDAAARTLLVVSFEGSTNGFGEGIGIDDAPIALAATSRLSDEEGQQLCDGLYRQEVALGDDTRDAVLRGSCSIPQRLLQDRFALRPPRMALKKGAVLVHRGQLSIYLRRCKPEEDVRFHLLGYLTKEGLRNMYINGSCKDPDECSDKYCGFCHYNGRDVALHRARLEDRDDDD